MILDGLLYLDFGMSLQNKSVCGMQFQLSYKLERQRHVTL